MSGAYGARPLLRGLPLTISVGQALSNLAAAARPRRHQRPAPATGHALLDVTALPLRTPMLMTPADPTNPLDAGAPGVLPVRGQGGPSGPGDADSPLPGSLLQLRCTEIRTYDRNPRTLPNEHREDIRQGLLASGQQGALMVTRRHPGEPYMLAAGANTTLSLLQELYRETGEARFEWVRCVFQPFDTEARLLAQHLGENLNRGDMKFWEVAQGMMQLLAVIDEERRQADPAAPPMGSREGGEQLTARGLRADKSGIATWRFAVQRLHGLGPLTRWLSRQNVRECLMPRLNALSVLAGRFGLSADVFWDEVVTPTLEVEALANARLTTLDAPHFCDASERALATRLDEDLAVLRQMLSILKLNPAATLADLRQPSPNLVVGPRPTPSASDWGGMEREGADDAGAADPTDRHDEVPEDGGASGARGSADLAAAPGDAANDGRAQPADRAAVAGLQPVAEPLDLLARLHAAVAALMDSHGLGACLRWQDELPLGYTLLRPETAAIADGRGHRAAQRLIWWQLRLMAVPDGCEAGPTGFGDAAALLGAAPPAAVEWLMACLLPGPLQPVLQSLRELERLAAAVLAAAPERAVQLRALATDDLPA